MLRVSDEPSPLRLFIRSRRVPAGLILTGILCLLVPLIGHTVLPMPTSGTESGTVAVPAWRLVAVAIALVPAICCQSPFGEGEAACGHHWRRLRTLVLAVYSTGSAVLLTVICWIAFGDAIAVAVLRGFIGWWGFSALTGRLLGWRLAWAGPLAALPLLIFWGFSLEGPRWWEFTARPAGDGPAWAVAIALLAVGVLAYEADPWRRQQLRAVLRAVGRTTHQ
jgi:hypothetical protein